MFKMLLPIVVVLALIVSAHPAFSDVALVKRGKPSATIVLPSNPSQQDTLGAEKFQYYVRKITGATLPITSQGAKIKGNKVLIGRQPDNILLIETMNTENSPEESSIVRADKGTVQIVGIDDVGTLHGIYFLLEELGCRWYFPGDWGTVIPQLKNLKVESGHRTYKPAMMVRAGLPTIGLEDDADSAWALNEWGRGNHLGGYRWWGAGHSYEYLVSAGKYFGEHPEWFALRDGKRETAQLCTTNLEMRKEAVNNLLATLQSYKNNVPKLICISPNDNNKFCECEECQKLIPTLPSGEKDWNNSIDRIADFANYMDSEIQKVYPGHYVTYYTHYHSIGTPQIVTPSENTVFWMTHWADDHFHGVNDTTKLGGAINDWSKYGNPIFLYTYWGAYGSYAFWPAVHAIENDIKYFQQHGAIGVYSETHQNWGGQHLNFIVFPRLLWNPDLTANEIIDDFCGKFFGPAAKPMRKYYEVMERAAISGPAQYQVQELLIPVFNSDVLKEMRILIDEANAKVAKSDAIYKTRMDFVTKGFRLGELYFSAQNLIRENKGNADESVRAKLIEMFEESKQIVENPKYKFKLTNKEFPAEPVIENWISALKQGTTFAPGNFKYNDTFYRGGRTYLDTVKRVGFIDGVWGLDMDSNADLDLIYNIQTSGGRLTDFAIEKILSYNNIAVIVSVADSIDGPWIEIASNTGPEISAITPLETPISLTDAVSGKPGFLLKINLRNYVGSYVCGVSGVSFSGTVTK